MSNGGIILFMWILFAFFNIIYLLKSDEGHSMMNSDEAVGIFLLGVIVSPICTIVALIVIINDLVEKLKEQEKEEKKLAEAAKRKASSKS